MLSCHEVSVDIKELNVFTARFGVGLERLGRGTPPPPSHRRHKGFGDPKVKGKLFDTRRGRTFLSLPSTQCAPLVRCVHTYPNASV